MANDGTLVMEDARVVFRNFAGKEGMYNREGDRNFCVILEPEIAMQMIEDGWNVKQLKSREEDVDGDFYIQVSVGFKNRPPRMVLLSSKGRVDLGQHECDLLDWVDILKTDLIVRPYKWDVNGKTGVKAYLKSIFITMNEDYLELKYSDIPYAIESGATNSIEATSELLAIEPGKNQAPAWEEDDEIVDGELVD